MPRYIDANKLRERLETFSRWCNDERKDGVDFVLSCALPDMPTANVVPRTNENDYVPMTDELMGEIFHHYGTKVAEEIFEELEFDIHQLMFERDETKVFAIEGIIAELKKKYTTFRPSWEE